MGNNCFGHCGSIDTAIFLGDAPTAPHPSNLFGQAAPGFRLHFVSGSTGFAAPARDEIASSELAAPPSAPDIWLFENGFPTGTDLDQETSGDRISLLLAYALDLDPHTAPRAGMPVPLLTPDSLSIRFHGSSPGVTYTAYNGTGWLDFPDDLHATWIRVTSEIFLKKATVSFTAGHDSRPANPSPPLFNGLAHTTDTAITGGILRARGGNKRNLHFAARNTSGDIGLYHLDPDTALKPVDNPTEHAWLKKHAAIPDLAGDLFNCHGTFYELPAENATGFARVRPVATHNRRITDYGSHRGLLVLSGIAADAPESNQHIILSTDGKTALWVGTIDDIWQLGKPVGRGAPWQDTPVEADTPSAPYLMTGYDKKTLTLSSKTGTTIEVEIDITGTGHWHRYEFFELTPENSPVTHTFPDHFQAYWLRTTSFKSTTATATAQPTYE